KSQLLRHPSKRFILRITSIADALNLLSDFLALQSQSLVSFTGSLAPPDPDPDLPPPNRNLSGATAASATAADRERRKLNRDEDQLLTHRGRIPLDADVQRVRHMLDACGRMVGDVRELTGILADDKGGVMLVFTAVTVVFLPLSFVAAYVSMLLSGGGGGGGGGGGDGQEEGMEWDAIHKLFWEVAGPLTVAVVVFCVGLTKAGVVREFLFGRMAGWGGRGQRGAVGKGGAVVKGQAGRGGRGMRERVKRVSWGGRPRRWEEKEGGLRYSIEEV
ncbi:hypothetical protein C8A05DRAFT_39623, partial [Staphylotrichum tortipilum]